MKRMTIVFMALIMCAGVVCGCGENQNATPKENAAVDEQTETDEDNPAEEEVDKSDEIDLELVGTRWKSDEHDNYYVFEENGVVIEEMISTSSSTTTVNGATSSHTSKSKREQSHKWVREGNTIIIDNIWRYELTEDGGEYKLTNGNVSYHMTDEDPMAESDDSAEASLNAEPYEINNPITTDQVEIVFTEKGFAEDLRITTGDGGIKTTSGPAPEEGKKHIYLKGTVKNLDKAAISLNVGGQFVIDGYNYDVRAYTWSATGNSATTIEPLEQLTYVLYAPIAEELADNCGSAILTFGFNDGFEIVSNLAEADHLYITTIVGDTVAAQEDENQIDKAEVAAPVKEIERKHKSEYTKLIYNNIDCVKVIQNALNEQGYSCGSVDGSIGNATVEAIKAFQRDNGMEQTGEINDELIDVLGCWDQADLKFFFSFCDKDWNPVDSFKRSEKVNIKLVCVDTDRSRNLMYEFKTIGPDGYVYYNEMDVNYDEEGNPGFGGFIYFNTPDQAPTGTMRCEVTDNDGNLLGVARVQVV